MSGTITNKFYIIQWYLKEYKERIAAFLCVLVVLFLPIIFKPSLEDTFSLLIKDKIEKKTGKLVKIENLRIGMSGLTIERLIFPNLNFYLSDMEMDFIINPFSDSFKKIERVSFSMGQMTGDLQKLLPLIFERNQDLEVSDEKNSISLENYFTSTAYVYVKIPQFKSKLNENNQLLVDEIKLKLVPLKREIEYRFGNVILNSQKIALKVSGSSKFSSEEVEKKLSFKIKAKESEVSLNVKGHIGFSGDGLSINMESDKIPEVIANKVSKYINLNANSPAKFVLSSQRLNQDQYDIKGVFQILNTKIQKDFLSDGVVGPVSMQTKFSLLYNKKYDEKVIKNLEIDFAKDQNFSEKTISLTSNLNQNLSDLNNLDFNFSLEPTDCQNFLDVAPASFVPYLQGFKLQGGVSLNANLQVNLDKPENFMFKKNSGYFNCKVVGMPETYSSSTLYKPFYYTLSQSDGQEFMMSTDPNSEDFTPINYISPNVMLAFVSSEDAGFWYHKGFDLSAIEQALRINLSEQSVKIGGSTITMQTVKNLFLSSKRNLSRKIQELFLSWHIERQLTKNRILEIYLNIIEFGPGIYGITRASKHFFAKHPSQLNLKEAAYLASILPSPIKRYKNFCQGYLTPSYENVVDIKLNQIHSQGRISFYQYLEARNTQLRFSRLGIESESSCMHKISLSPKFAIRSIKL